MDIPVGDGKQHDYLKDSDDAPTRMMMAISQSCDVRCGSKAEIGQVG